MKLDKQFIAQFSQFNNEIFVWISQIHEVEIANHKKFSGTFIKASGQ